ncbi:MAG: hypothetical protein AVO33_06565 [delta proteobacterium ML8_F1]|nr:MAG: hypothetical protein AVO33_06565 [delta proteobacterium ML8_F1]
MDRKEYLKGLAFGTSGFIMWGLLPLYWKMVQAISPYQVFSHRVIWSFVFVLGILHYKGLLKGFKRVVFDRGQLKRILLPAFFISVNWLLYIWAVNNNYVIETSLGYFINPLVLTVFGAIFYKERLNRLQKIGVFFAVAGVLVKTLYYGRVPVIALTLAFAFASYGLFKKKSSLTSLEGLGLETLIISIPALGYLLLMESQGGGIIGNLSLLFWPLIMLSGVMTATPLIFYSEAVKRLPLSIMGFLQYIAPTIMMVLAIFVFKEPFDLIELGAFTLIWIGLGFFSYSQYLLLKG